MKKCLFSSRALLEPVLGSPRSLEQSGKLSTRLKAWQYATANGTAAAASSHCAPELESGICASEIHAGGLDARPRGTRPSRTSSAVSDAGVKTAHNSRAGSRKFFPTPLSPDGPRRPAALRRTVAVAGAPAPGTGTLVADGTRGPARWTDTAAPPANMTNDAQLLGTLRCNSGPEDEAEKTAFRNPSRDTSATGCGQVLAAAANDSHPEYSPREPLTPEGHVPEGSYHLPSGTLFHRLPPRGFPSIQLNGPRPLLKPSLRSPRYLAPRFAAINSRAPWLPGPAKMAPG